MDCIFKHKTNKKDKTMRKIILALTVFTLAACDNYDPWENAPVVVYDTHVVSHLADPVEIVVITPTGEVHSPVLPADGELCTVGSWEHFGYASPADSADVVMEYPPLPVGITFAYAPACEGASVRD